MAWITLLYVLSAALPTLGIALALLFLRHPGAQLKRYRKTQAKYEQDRKAAEVTGDTDLVARLQAKYEQDSNKKDRFGRALGSYGGIARFEDSTIVAERQYNGLRRDALFIIAGLICGAVASIWSLYV
jgi:hypothetical protein